jgi:4-amino-4-deoxy-L-arabinose transferase-like glycosyltransferase
MADRQRKGPSPSSLLDALGVAGVALGARLAVVAWAHARFAASEDGFYYDTLARRLASGAGYTWLWPDGAVTYAAHYPVGYPGMLAAAYAVLWASPGVAMTVNAIVGAASAYGAHRLVARAQPQSRWRAIGAGLALALHPALVPYTAAVMTEGVTAAILVVAAALAARAREGPRPARWVALAGVVMGVATLVRPQSLVLAPVLGALAAGEGARWRQRLSRAGVLLAIAASVCLPWTARNCKRLDRCALVSVNGGWNLLIGTQTRDGAWARVDVPDACRTVWSEAMKDVCFGRAARDEIARAPLVWIARAPAKLAATFDYFGAAPWYLHAANARAFDERAKIALGTVETIASRVALLAALVALGRFAGPRPLARKLVAFAGAAFAVTLHAWIGYVALVVATAVLGRRALAHSLALPFSASVIAATALTHAVFFGAGRYGLVVAPFVACVAFTSNAEERKRIVGALPPESCRHRREAPEQV